MVMIVFSCAACSENSKVPNISAVTDSDMRTEYNGQTYNVHIHYVNSSTASVLFHSPDTVKNLSFNRADGKCSVSLGGLVCRSEKPHFMNESLPVGIIDIFDSVNQNKENAVFKTADKDGYYFEIQNVSGNITVLTDEKGTIKSVKTKELSINSV